MTNTICPECGSTFDPSAGFCPKCGREVKATQSPKTYQVPDKSPEELMAVGFNHMADGSYDEGLACWNKAVDGGIVPDDDTYSRMVDSAGACMVIISSTSKVDYHPGVVDLDLKLDDRDFASDLLNDIRGRLHQCTTQPALVNLSTNHMLLLTDCFNLYTDMRDMKVLCDGSRDFMDAVRAREGEMSSDGMMEPEKASKYIDTNVDFINRICGTVDRIIGRIPPETLDTLADKWADQSTLSYVYDIKLVLNVCIQLRVAGKMMTKLLTKTLDSQCNIIATKYISLSK